MSQLTDYLSGYLNELDNYMNRLNNNKLSRKDRKLFLEMSSEYYELFHNKDIADPSEALPGEFFQAMEGFNENISSQDEEGKDRANQYYEDITKYANSHINNVKRIEMMLNVFKIDTEISRLQDEKLQVMQELVDQEMALNGDLTQELQSILELQQCEVLNGKVRKIMDWEILEDAATKQEPSEKETKNMISRFTDDIDMSAIFYDEKGEKQKIVIESVYEKYDTSDAAFQHLFELVREKKPEWKENERCYIQSHDNDSGKNRLEGVYLVKSGRDVTPVEIHIPDITEKSEFMELISFLKEKGAKYNPNPQKKFWYFERGSLTPELGSEVQERLDSYKRRSEPNRSVLGKQRDDKKVAKPMKEKRVISNEELDSILAKSGDVKLSDCRISNYVFKGDLSNINFDNSELRYCEFRHTKASQLSMKNTTLADVKFVQAEFDDCDFRRADYNGVQSRGSIFRNCSLQDAVMRQTLMDSSYFYKTSFFDTRIRQTNLSGENVFYECADIDTVKIETPAMRSDEAEKYIEKVTNALNNEGYEYSWTLNGVNIEAREAELTVKISNEGEIVEDKKYYALLNDDTYEIVHVDTGRLEDPVVKMLIPEMNAVIRDSLGMSVEKTSKTSVHEKLHQYKNTVKEQVSDNHTIGSRKNEVPELV